MARTTGYTATAAVNMFLDGLITKKGVLPPNSLVLINHAMIISLITSKKEG